MERGEDTQRPREEAHEATEAKTGVIDLQAKKGQGLPKAPRW